GVRQGPQGRVLLRPGQQGQNAGGLPGARGQSAHLGRSVDVGLCCRRHGDHGRPGRRPPLGTSAYRLLEGDAEKVADLRGWVLVSTTTILSIQSSVAYGHVGNSAAVFPLQRLGVEVWPVHTVHFSNHTGYGAWRGPLLAAEDVREVITGVEEREAMPEIDAVLSGYQGGTQIGDVILDAVARVKAANPAAIYACDPVMGNAASGCFVHPDIPVLLRDKVVPKADLITPNQFELGFLTRTEPSDL